MASPISAGAVSGQCSVLGPEFVLEHAVGGNDGENICLDLPHSHNDCLYTDFLVSPKGHYHGYLGGPHFS